MSDALQDAQLLYRESLGALAAQRRQIEEDIKFSDPSNPQQWEEDVKLQRETDPGGKRPCLVMDQTGQYSFNVVGQFEKSPPSIHAIPVGGGADKKAAEQMDGRFRHIEYASRASQHYVRALTSAARLGVGYLTVRPEYVDRALGWQEPRIGSEADPLSVVLDPWSVDTDGADATFGYILSPMSLREFDRRWKGKDQQDFGDTGVLRNDDTRKSILLAEQFFKESKTREMLVYSGADGEEVSGEYDEYVKQCQAAGVQLPVTRQYKDKYQCVKWRRMSGAEVLEESEYQADAIGIVPVYGYIGFVDGRITYCGIPRRARSAQQAYNYHVSEQLAYIGTMPKAPWLVSKRAAAGVEGLWDKSSSQSRAWLPYNDIDDLGAIAQPNRVSPSANLVNHEAGAAQALRDIQASIGMYQANLGAKSNETSGVAIDARKEQGEASTAHFPSHMAASLGQVGNIVMQMDAKLSDTRRSQPIIGVDGSPGQVVVDPDQQTAFERAKEGVTINPKIGKYSIRVVVGASYSTQRSQTNAAFAEIMRGNKELAPVVAPFWAQTLDFPGSDKFAQAMATMSPPAVKAILQPEGAEDAPDPAMLAGQLQEMQQALQEALQHAQEAQKDADEAIDELAAVKRDDEVKRLELDIKAFDSETKRLQVTGANVEQIEAVTKGLIEEMLSHPDPLPGDSPRPAQTQAEVPMQETEMAAEPQDPMQAPATREDVASLLESQQQLQAAMQELIKVASSTRTKVPVRDKEGNILRVIETVEAPQTLQ